MNNVTTSESTGVTSACCAPGCCDGREAAQPAAQVTAVVREQYGRTAKSGLSSKNQGVRAVAEAFGYTPEELSSIPAEANMGLSCGNPTAMAHLRTGEVVVDLGSGGGLDVFLAAQKVGPTGKAIGIDMTPEMIELSRRNATKDGRQNVEFHLATIDALPLPDASVDVVISNCVINLAPNKEAVFREIARVLKPGGRLAVSDIALKRLLPEEIARSVTAYVGCISGALLIDEYRHQLRAAGFANVLVVDSAADLNAYAMVEGQSGCCSPATPSRDEPVADSGCCSAAQASATQKGSTSSCCGTTQPADSSSVHNGLGGVLDRYDVNAYAASVKVYAVKP